MSSIELKTVFCMICNKLGPFSICKDCQHNKIYKKRYDKPGRPKKPVLKAYIHEDVRVICDEIARYLLSSDVRHKHLNVDLEDFFH